MQCARLFLIAYRPHDMYQYDDDACGPCLDIRAVEFGAIWTILVVQI